MLGSPYKFSQHGRNGAWVSETLPHFSKIVDDVAIITRSGGVALANVLANDTFVGQAATLTRVSPGTAGPWPTLMSPPAP